MNTIYNFLDALPRISTSMTRSISAENPTGAKSGGAQAAPGDDEHCSPAARRLGKGWKVRPCLVDIAAQQTVTIADIAGPGTIQHIWITVEPALLRTIAFRVYYDDQEHPSIETPLGDFFANGVNGLARIGSLPIAVNPRGGMNAYWPMPFRKRIRIQITNDGPAPIPAFFYQITYALCEVEAEAAYLHASWRRATTTRDHSEHIILDGVAGRGHYIGTYLVWSQLANGWWGEGEMKFFIDGEPADSPTICGTGTEDYFGGAWGFTAGGADDARPACYSGPFLGYPQAVCEPSKRDGQRVPVHGLYRWHIPDPIRFTKDLRVTIQALGWWPDGTYQPLADDIASVAYWYQTLRSAPLKPLPPMEERWAR
jgi:hypothetical protein